jgi:hypothetical protein
MVFIIIRIMGYRELSSRVNCQYGGNKMDEGWFNQVFFEDNLNSRVDQNEKIFTQEMWLLKAIRICQRCKFLCSVQLGKGC